MSAAGNPYLGNVDRAPYELRHLLRHLSPHLPAPAMMDSEERKIAEAVQQHAENTSTTLLHGMEALGKLMSAAGCDRSGEIDQRTLMGLGELVAYLAVEAQLMQELTKQCRKPARLSPQLRTVALGWSG